MSWRVSVEHQTYLKETALLVFVRMSTIRMQRSQGSNELFATSRFGTGLLTVWHSPFQISTSFWNTGGY